MDNNSKIKWGSVSVPIKKVIYKDFRETFMFDCGIPVFITNDGKYTFAKTIEDFKYGIEHLTTKYFQTTTVQTFKSYFKSLVKHYGFPKEEAAEVLQQCLQKFEQAKPVVVSKRSEHCI